MRVGLAVKAVVLAAALLATRAAHAGDAEVNIVFAGDIMLDETPGQVVARGDDPFAHFAALLDGADLAVGNLECAIATSGQALDKPFTFRAAPAVTGVLARHFGALALANNHSSDFGPQSFLDTMKNLDAAHIPHFGGGANLSEAHRPLILERKGLRIALLGYNEFLPRWFEAGPTWPGIAWAEDEQIIRDMRAARAAGAHIVIPFIHWGWENETSPCQRQRELARKLIDAGADAVVGGHPHVTQGAEMYRGRLILYSLGNFLFNGFESEAATTGWLLHLTVAKDGVRTWNTRVARLDKEGLPRLDERTASPCGRAGDNQVSMCTKR